ncbi:ribonuclease H-like domain-containing protein [Tanacetum coccineum]
MEHYLTHTDYPIWEVIQRGNGPVSVSTNTNGLIKVLPPKTAEEILARERDRKARTTLLMALPEDHLAKFHKMTDAKEMWEAIKSRFGGNDKSKKMQKYILKQQFEGFFVSLLNMQIRNSFGLYLLPGLKFPSNHIGPANQSGRPHFDDLYNNLRVFEFDVKGSTASSSSTQNVTFVLENTSSTNDVSTAYGVSNSSDLKQLDEFDFEEMDLKWQVAIISMRMKKFYKKTGRKLQFDAKKLVGFDKTKFVCYSCHKTGHFVRECRFKGNQDSRRRDAWNTGNKDKENRKRSGKQEDSKASVTLDGEGVDWTSHSEDEQENYALMACSSSGSDTEREQLRDASIEIHAYTQALKKVKAQLVAHKQSQLWSQIYARDNAGLGVLVTKPQNKTPYELITGKIPIISYIRPFGCHVTILNTIDHLGKFDGKSDEGFLVGYSLQSKAFRVYNLETKRVEENLHITFLENKPNVAGKGPTWLFDLDYLTDSMNYQPVRSENQANKHAGLKEANHSVGTEDNIDAGNSEIEAESAQDYFVLPIWSSYTSTVKSSKVKNAGEEPNKNPDFKTDEKPVDKEEFAKDTKDLLLQAGAAKASSTNTVNTASTPVSTASPYASYDDEGAVADFTNLETIVNVNPIPTSRINSIHPSTLILGDPNSAVQTRSKVTKSSGAHAFVSYIQKQRRNNHKDFQHCLFACFLSQNEPKKISEALEDESWVDAMQEELLQFKIQKGKIDDESGYRRGTINKTLFIKKDKNDIMLVQVYVDDIIFGSTKRSWCDEFETLMKSRFQMSSMGELTFFLGLQSNSERRWIWALNYLTVSRPEIILHPVLCSSFKETYSWQCKKQNNCGYFYYRANMSLPANSVAVVDARIKCRLGGSISMNTRSTLIMRYKYALVLKIHIDDNVVDLLTKAFDVNRFQFLSFGYKLKNVPVPLDHFPINALTSKVFSFMVKKGKHFSGNVTPLFDSMLVQPTKDEGDTLERQSKPQPIPSPPHLNFIPEGSGGNHGDQAKEIKHLKAHIKKLKKKAKPVITHHKAWMKSVSMKQRLAGKKSLKKQWMQKESVSKYGRKPAKAEPTVLKDPTFDELDDDTMDYMETEDAQDMGRTSYMVHEEKESAEKGVSTEDLLSTAQPKVSTDKSEDSTDKPDEGTDKPKVSTDKEEVSTDRPDEGTVDQNEGRSATQTAPTIATPTIFGNDETIAQVLIIMSQNKEKLKEKEKGVELKDLARDEEVTRKVHEDWEAEEVKKLAEEEATKAALANEYDFIQARLNADKILAKKLQEEEREISEAIRNKPPSRNQLNNQMMTYLKHVGGKKHSDMKTKGFEEIKALYDKIKRSDDSFIAIGSAEDEKVSRR